MASDRRRSAKKSVGQNLNDLDRRVKRVERRNRSTIDRYSVTGDNLAPGSITIDKLDPSLVALIRTIYSANDAAGDSLEEGNYSLYEEIESVYSFSTNSASGKNSIFYSPTEPAGDAFSIDDIWFDTAPDTDGDPKYEPHKWDGDSWEPAPLGDAAFRFLDVGKLATGVLDAAVQIRVGQFPTQPGLRRLEITGGSGVAFYETTLSANITSTALSMTVADASVFSAVPPPYHLVLDGDDNTKIEIVRVTEVSGNTLTIVRGRTPRAHISGAKAQYKETTTAGFRVLQNDYSQSFWDGKTPAVQSALQGNLTELFSLNANDGSLFLGSGDETLKFNTVDSPNRLSISGQIRVGEGLESLLIGKDLVDGANNLKKDGIQLGTQNFWYRPNNAVASNSTYFQVSGGGTKAIRVEKDGDVFVEGTTNPTGGTIKGRLSVRLGEGNASDKFIIGQNVSSLSGLTGDEFDGIKLDTNNYWVLSNTAKKAYLRVGTSTKNLSFDGATGLLKLTGGDITLTGGGSFKTSDGNTRVEMNSNGIFGYTGNGTKTFWIDAATGDSSFEGITNPTGGTVKGKLTIQGTTYAFGKDVMSVRDGLYLNANNYWTLSQTGATAELKVGGTSRYLEWTGGQLNIRTDTLLIGDQSAATQAYADSAAGAAFSSVNVLQKLNDSITGVSITSLGYIFSAGKNNYQSTTDGWFIGFNDLVNPRRPVLNIGNADQYVKWTGTALEIQAKNPSAGLAGFSLTGGDNPNIVFGDEDTTVQMDRNGFFFNGYPGLSGPNSVRGRFTIRQSYADSSVNFSMFGVNVTNYTTTPIARIKIRDTAPTSSTSAGSIEILGNVSITGNLSVSGTGGGGSGGYSNATDGTTTNKITYGGSAPTSGRTAGDIHIEF